MKHLLIILSIILLSSPVIGQSKRPETIIIPVSSLGDVSEVRKQILQNTLEDELKTHFRLVPQQRFEEVQEKVFEELEYEECTADQCIMMIQEMLQVENVFHLQVIGEDSDTQLSLGWRTLDEKKKETDICLKCGTFQLNEKVRGLVEKLVVGKTDALVVVVSRDDEEELRKQREEELRRQREDELKKQREDELKKQREDELKKQREEEELKRKEEEELKRKEEEEKIKLLIPLYNTRKLSIFAGYCSTQIGTGFVDANDSTSLEITQIIYDGFSIGGRYYLNRNFSLSGDLCSGLPSDLQYTSTDNSEQHSVNDLSGRTNNTSFSTNYSWDFNAHSFYAGGGISYHSSKIQYIDSISKLNHNININGVFPNIILGYDYIVYYISNLYIFNVDLKNFTQLKTIEFTNNNKKYRTFYTYIWRVSIGRSF
jgi:hypothetical protein